MYRLILFFGVMVTTGFILPSEGFASDCAYWWARVGVKDAKIPATYVDENDLKRVLEGIECLLAVEGDKSVGAFGRATHNQVSEMLPMATTEICALYYISKLFYQRYDHANGVVLVDEKKRWNRPVSVEKAYTSYRAWFEKVKRIGIEEARARKLDPLAGSGIRWY